MDWLLWLLPHLSLFFCLHLTISDLFVSNSPQYFKPSMLHRNQCLKSMGEGGYMSGTFLYPWLSMQSSMTTVEILTAQHELRYMKKTNWKYNRIISNHIALNHITSNIESHDQISCTRTKIKNTSTKNRSKIFLQTKSSWQ